MPLLLHDDRDAERGRERRPRGGRIGDIGQPVAALALLRLVAALVGDELGAPRPLLAQLQAPGRGREVGVALAQDAVLDGAGRERRRASRLRIVVAGLELEVAPRVRHAVRDRSAPAGRAGCARHGRGSCRRPPAAGSPPLLPPPPAVRPTTPPAGLSFRRAWAEAAAVLAYESMRDVAVEHIKV